MITASCKYAPIELFSGFGEETRFIDTCAENFDRADGVAHVNLCGFGKTVIEEALSGSCDRLVLVNCCDTMRRASEVVQAAGCCSVSLLMDLPHTCGPCQVDALAAELARVRDRIAEATGETFDLARCQAAFRAPAPEASGPYVGVFGVRCGRELERAIEDACPLPVRNLTCTGLRSIALDGVGRETDDERVFFRSYAQALLAQTPCRRMADDSQRQRLFEDPNLRGIVYHTMKFCDFYTPEFARLARTADVPLLKIESDFTRQSAEQLTTRIEAFCETIEGAARAGGADGAAKPGAERAGERAKGDPDARTARTGRHDADAAGGPGSGAREGGRCFAGIDSGSTSTDVVVIDDAGEIVATAIVPTGGGAQKSAEACLASALQAAGIGRSAVARIVATGYGRSYLDESEGSITEISCHAKGAHRLYPAVRTIIDIGGQDSKVIRVNEHGGVENFIMNDKCAAGTGRFLEMMARALQLSLADLSTRGLSWREDITISAMCSVFAESEVVSLVAQNKDIADIVHGLDKSVASKVGSLIKRTGGEAPYMMTGGVAKNEGVVRAIEDTVGAPVYVCDEAQLAGALGAALFARERYAHSR